MSTLRKVKVALRNKQVFFDILHPFHKAWRSLLMRAAQARYGINMKKVVFSSFDGRSYNDNPRYISERLHELCPDCEIVWLVRPSFADKVQLPPYVKMQYPISRAGLVEQATAGFWVDNVRHMATIRLDDKRQYYIQTWHGDRGFKRVVADNEKLAVKLLYIEDRCAMMIAGSRFGANTYRTAFHYKGEILMDGCPRNDLLIRNDPKEAAEIRRRLGVPDGVKLLMYAPTYRTTSLHSAQKAVLDIPRTLDYLERTKGECWYCLYRAHYMNTTLSVQSDPRLIDACRYPEMSELLLVTDMLITDYSSCGGDFALLRRPVFLYQADAEEYLSESRSFYFDIDESPFLVARSPEELEKLIDETDAEAARENCEALDRFFGTTETGHATDAVCKYIMDRMK